MCVVALLFQRLKSTFFEIFHLGLLHSKFKKTFIFAPQKMHPFLILAHCTTAVSCLCFLQSFIYNVMYILCTIPSTLLFRRRPCFLINFNISKSFCGLISLAVLCFLSIVFTKKLWMNKESLLETIKISQKTRSKLASSFLAMTIVLFPLTVIRHHQN